MSLLTDLTLAYETLADDPIEVGIHYGRSILNVLATPLTPAPVPVLVEQPSTASFRPVMGRMIKRSAPVAPARSSHSAYRMRPSMGYTQRNLVGAL